MAFCAKLREMYHHQQSSEGRSPSSIENKAVSSYALTTLVSSASIPDAINVRSASTVSPDTIDSGYNKTIFSFGGLDYQLEDLDDLIDEVGEAEDDRAAVGIEDEDYTSSLAGADISSQYFGPEDGDYAALEPPPQEMYLQSLLDTDIETLMPYGPKLRSERVGDGFYVSYYNSGAGTEEVAELEVETEDEPIFTATPTPIEDSEPEAEPNFYQKGDGLEARLGFKGI